MKGAILRLTSATKSNLANHPLLCNLWRRRFPGLPSCKDGRMRCRQWRPDEGVFVTRRGCIPGQRTPGETMTQTLSYHTTGSNTHFFSFIFRCGIFHVVLSKLVEEQLEHCLLEAKASLWFTPVCSSVSQLVSQLVSPT